MRPVFLDGARRPVWQAGQESLTDDLRRSALKNRCGERKPLSHLAPDDVIDLPLMSRRRSIPR
jgi:hypothetical protein